MNERYWQKKVKAAEVEGGHRSGRPRFVWIDGVRRALAVREVGLLEATQLARERNVWRELVRA